MNLEHQQSQRQETIHVSAPSVVNSSSNNNNRSSGTTTNSSNTTTTSNTMPQRTPFAIQELLGLSESSRSSSAVTAVTPSSLYTNVGQTPFSSEHHQMQMAASRMAYFNAHAAVAAAFLPHNMAAGAAGGPLSFTPQAPSVVNSSSNNNNRSSGTTTNSSNTTTTSNTMPQRTPFAIQELLGLSESSRSSSAVTAVTPSSLYTNVGQTPFSSEHHQMQMAASRMAYFNAHAAVAAAFLPHNMAAGAAGGPLSFTPQVQR
uniref:CSON001706 protein n=1 Tax=Culicoides sonorensis TaxID=179676 RepID=A0A336KYZ2_CULSO